jgi:hypothetical protein
VQKTTRMRHSMLLLLMVFAAPAVGGEDLPPKPRLAKDLVMRLKVDPCPLLEEIFRPTDAEKRACSKLRESNGDLVVELALQDGEKEIEMIKAGQRCHYGIVGADGRPRKKPRWVSSLSIVLEAKDEKALAFTGRQGSYKLGTDGSVETISKDCSDITGQLRFVNKKWRLQGSRSEGCSE